eukprot:scaffold1469_cov257-Pinguiococcus_pyrenoidosus.AAC.9
MLTSISYRLPFSANALRKEDTERTTLAAPFAKRIAASFPSPARIRDLRGHPRAIFCQEISILAAPLLPPVITMVLPARLPSAGVNTGGPRMAILLAMARPMMPIPRPFWKRPLREVLTSAMGPSWAIKGPTELLDRLGLGLPAPNAQALGSKIASATSTKARIVWRVLLALTASRVAMRERKKRLDTRGYVAELLGKPRSFKIH